MQAKAGPALGGWVCGGASEQSLHLWQQRHKESLRMYLLSRAFWTSFHSSFLRQVIFAIC